MIETPELVPYLGTLTPSVEDRQTFVASTAQLVTVWLASSSKSSMGR